MDSKEFIARRVALMLNDGDVINLGIGMPTMVADYVPEGINVMFQSENGIIGLGPAPEAGKEDPNIINAGGKCVTVVPEAKFLSSAESFGMIRGGHVAMSVLGALQVDEKGNLANWYVPGKSVPGMGGAMDLVVGARKVTIAMTHTAKGNPKILKQCSFPLTAVGVVDYIVTEMCMMEVTPNGLVMTELAPDYTVEQVKAATEADFTVSPDLKVMTVE